MAADSAVTQLSVDAGVGALKLLHLGAIVVQSAATISGSCGTMTATGTTTLVGSSVSVLGLPPLMVPVNPVPNTVLVNALGIKIVLNEQIVSGDGVTSRGLTVNAIHIYLNNAHVGGGSAGWVVSSTVRSSSRRLTPSTAARAASVRLPPPAGS